MYIDRLLLQKEAPKDTKVAWGIPQGENVAVNVHVDGKWRPIAGSSNSSSDSSGCGCEDVIIKEMCDLTAQPAFNYTVEKGNFEEVYNGILSGKVYTFNISSFTSVQEAEGVFVYLSNNLIANARGMYSVAANTSRPEIKIKVGNNDFTWTPEGITNEKSPNITKRPD